MNEYGFSVATNYLLPSSTEVRLCIMVTHPGRKPTPELKVPSAVFRVAVQLVSGFPAVRRAKGTKRQLGKLVRSNKA